MISSIFFSTPHLHSNSSLFYNEYTVILIFLFVAILLSVTMVLFIFKNLYKLKIKTNYFISYVHFSYFNRQKSISYVINVGLSPTNKLTQNSVLYLSVLIVCMFCFLLANNAVECCNSQIFNNNIIVDFLSFSSKIWIAIMSVFCLLMVQRFIAIQKINYFEYSVLILLALLNAFFICSSNDLITAYLSIELQSLSLYVMASTKKDSSFSIDAGLKYFILGAFSSSLFLFGSSILYGISGTINFEDLKNLFFLTNIEYDSIQRLDNHTFVKNIFLDGSLVQFALVFIFVSLLFKLIVAPFHLWSLDVYEESPSSSTFFFTIVPKLAIFVLLIRIFYLSFFEQITKWRYYIIVIAILTIIVGSFGVLEQKKLKTFLAYSSISHMGYTLIALSTGTFECMQILFCYIFLYMIAGLCIWLVFLVLQLKYKHIKKQNKDLADLNLLSKSNNILALFFSLVIIYTLPSSSCKCDTDTSETTFRIARAAFVEERSRAERLGEEYTISDQFRYRDLAKDYKATLEAWSSDTGTSLVKANWLVGHAEMLVDTSNEPRSGAVLGVVAQWSLNNALLSLRLADDMCSRLDTCKEEKWLFHERSHIECRYGGLLRETPTNYAGAVEVWDVFEASNRTLGLSLTDQVAQASLVRSTYLSETSDDTWARSNAISEARPALLELWSSFHHLWRHVDMWHGTTRAMMLYAREELFAARAYSQGDLSASDTMLAALRVVNAEGRVQSVDDLFHKVDAARGRIEALSARPGEIAALARRPRERWRASNLLEAIAEPQPIDRNSLGGANLVDAPSIGAISTDSGQINQSVVESATKGSDIWDISPNQMEYSSFFYNTPSECSGLFSALVRLASAGWWFSYNWWMVSLWIKSKWR